MFVRIWGKKESKVASFCVCHCYQDHHQFIEDIEDRLGFCLRLCFSFLRLDFFWFAIGLVLFSIAIMFV